MKRATIILLSIGAILILGGCAWHIETTGFISRPDTNMDNIKNISVIPDIEPIIE